jgi:DNA helicase HerA-like ATPase
MVENAVKLGCLVSVNGAKVTAMMDAGSGTPTDAIQFGGLVKILTPVSSVFGMVTGLWVSEAGSDRETSRRMMSVDLLGEVPKAGVGGQAPAFRRGVSCYPHLDAQVHAVTAADLAVVYARPDAANARVGVVGQDHDLSAYVITDRLLGKHFAVLGTTGTGKSCAVTLILRSILDRHANGHIIVLDPHNEYGAAFGDLAEIINPSNLHLPYWLMNFDELAATFVSAEGSDRQAEMTILKQAVLDCRRNFVGDEEDAAHLTVDTPVPFRLGEVERMISSGMGRLNKAESSLPYQRLLSRIEAMRSDRRFEFMFAGLVVRDTMGDVLSRLLRVPVGGRPVTVIDLSGVPSEIVDVLVSLVCRMIFDFALWSVRAKAVPVLLVCEEAHRYVPQDPTLGFALSRAALSRIAKEGRKYGVSLCLVSQRPGELSTTILSQCNTLFALRLSNDQDQEFVRRTLPDGASGLLSALPALHNREAIAVGEGVSVPMRLCFDDLASTLRPRSGSACFSAAWEGDAVDRSFVEDTIERWRRQERDDCALMSACG